MNDEPLEIDHIVYSTRDRYVASEDDVEDVSLEQYISYKRLDYSRAVNKHSVPTLSRVSNARRNHSLIKYRFYLDVRSIFPNFSWRNLFSKAEAEQISNRSIIFTPQQWSDILDSISINHSDLQWYTYQFGLSDTVNRALARKYNRLRPVEIPEGSSFDHFFNPDDFEVDMSKGICKDCLFSIDSNEHRVKCYYVDLGLD